MPERVQPASYVTGPYLIQDYPEAASQSGNNNGFVTHTSGEVQAAAAAGNDVGNVAILGLQMRAFAGVQETKIPVLIAQNDTVFAASLSNQDAGGTWAETDLDAAYDLRHVTSGYGYTVDKGSAVNARANIVGVVPGTETDTFPTVLFKIVAASRVLS